jgi:acyl-CoA thioester hydrolase
MAKDKELFLTVGPEHIDFNLHVNNVVYLQWVQMMSKTHWEEEATPDMIKEYMWVITRQEIDYLRELKEGDEVRLYTYIEKSEKQKSYRNVEIYKMPENILVAKAQIVWTMLSQINKKPMRIPQEVIDLYI